MVAQINVHPRTILRSSRRNALKLIPTLMMNKMQRLPALVALPMLSLSVLKFTE
jgi:hypothetical protein